MWLARIGAWPIRLVARIPATIHAKLLAAFLAMVSLLIAVGIVGLQQFGQMNRRAETLVALQQRIAVSRKLQLDTTAELYALVTAVLVPDSRTLAEAAHGLDQFAGDLDLLQALEPGEPALRQQIRLDADRFIELARTVLALIEAGKIFEAQTVQSSQIRPLADTLSTLTSNLVTKSEADMAISVDIGREAYKGARLVIGGFVLGSIALALALGYVISWSIIHPVRRVHEGLRQTAAGDFSRQIDVPNRDELGALAANANRMNAQLHQLYEELQTVSRHKSEFLANMSHELRTPLNAILGYTELVLDGIYGETPEKIKDVLQRVQRSGRHLLALINDVLDLSKIEAGRLTLSFDAYSMPDIVHSVATAMEPLAAEKNLVLRVFTPADSPPAFGDLRRISQVLLNLISNAIKFTEVGEVRVEVTTRNNDFLVSVADTGPGISVHEQERIFEKFYQANSRAIGGAGLGLAIARRIVQLHGGQMWVVSTPGHGSTFWFTLPVRVDRPAEVS